MVQVQKKLPMVMETIQRFLKRRSGMTGSLAQKASMAKKMPRETPAAQKQETTIALEMRIFKG
ncbi:hypothetical protein BC938DRAFT_483948 [Jimgerdemannia flammicorona]|uniref:Uncharacterized protein n=1 Tax=Jimgerdemannia flammicorona TaxID=994334 RepID=A0A433QVP3_9FUNG|nr:hypothetical protein BC938DRAFT_483948 [Jimgerdemannia flammicorona]